MVKMLGQGSFHNALWLGLGAVVCLVLTLLALVPLVDCPLCHGKGYVEMMPEPTPVPVPMETKAPCDAKVSILKKWRLQNSTAESARRR